jgi:hypothetical protein
LASLFLHGCTVFQPVVRRPSWPSTNEPETLFSPPSRHVPAEYPGIGSCNCSNVWRGFRLPRQKIEPRNRHFRSKPSGHGTSRFWARRRHGTSKPALPECRRDSARKPKLLCAAVPLTGTGSRGNSARENDELSWDDRNSAFMVLKEICFGALRAQPEMSHLM